MGVSGVWVPNGITLAVEATHTKLPLLFAPASATINRYPDTTDDATDYTRHLVTVLPKGAQIKITTSTPIAIGQGDGDAWTDHDLRRDLLLMCHDNRQHTSLADTSQYVRTLAWFPKMKSYIKYHVDSCPYCVSKRKTTTPVGTAVRCARRLKMVEFDHKILDDDIKTRTGCPAVLTIVDVVSRVTMFIPVSSHTAVTTATDIYTHWYPLFGSPAVFRMDNAPEFTSEVTKAFHDIMGVRHLDFSAPDDPTHHAMVERCNKVMEKMLDVSSFNGDINTIDDLHMHCATACSSSL